MNTDYKGIITWSDEDECYVGTCPELFAGGCHGDTKEDVQNQLDAIIADVVDDFKKENKPLPKPSVRKARTASALEARKSTGLNQKQFAELIGVGVGTLRNWEQKRVEPKGTAHTLLRIISMQPNILHEIEDTDPSVHNSRKRKPIRAVKSGIRNQIAESV